MLPIWLREAQMYIGVREIKGAKHHPLILGWWQKIRASFRDDETPWCAAFVGGVLEKCGILSTRSAAARSYLTWGVKLDVPAVGAIAVLWRGNPKSASGHVGFVLGRDTHDNIVLLGGNQGDAVSVKSFAQTRVLSYRWPTEKYLPDSQAERLPVFKQDGTVSTDEA